MPEARAMNIAFIPMILVHIIENLVQIKLILIEVEALAQLVDEERNIVVVRKVTVNDIFNDVALAKVLDVFGGVHKAVQKSGVNCDDLGAALVALLECHTVQQERSLEDVDGYTGHFNHTALKFYLQEAVRLARSDPNPRTAEIRDAGNKLDLRVVLFLTNSREAGNMCARVYVSQW
jgi:hypothetical protein